MARQRDVQRQRAVQEVMQGAARPPRNVERIMSDPFRCLLSHIERRFACRSADLTRRDVRSTLVMEREIAND
jgi:hypothetical protein